VREKGKGKREKGKGKREKVKGEGSGECAWICSDHVFDPLRIPA
jgi:hypothetical protein